MIEAFNPSQLHDPVGPYVHHNVAASDPRMAGVFATDA